nr:ABC transporter ATP-binding protein [Qipengyuania proteolytica]
MLAAVSAVAALAVPLILRTLVDTYLGKTGNAQYVPVVIALVGCLVAGSAAEGLRAYLANRAEIDAALRLKAAFTAQMLCTDLRFFSGNDSGFLTSIILNDVEATTKIYSAAINLLVAVVMLVFSIAILFALDWRLALLASLVVIVSILVVTPLAIISGRLQKTLLANLALGGSTLFRVFTNVRLVKANVMESAEVDRIGAVLANLRDQKNAMSRATSFIGPVITIVFSCGVLALTIVGAARVADGTLSGGTLAAFFAYILGLIPLLFQIGSGVQASRMAVASSSSICRIHEEAAVGEDALQRASCAPVPGPGCGPLVIERLRLSYPGEERPAVSVPSLHVPEGAFVSIVGGNGSGKSTFLSALLRLHPVSEGAITWSRTSIHDYDLKSWRRSIAYAAPTATLLPGTLRENLVYGCEDLPTASAIEDALFAVGADRFVAAKSAGLDTVIDDKGGGLSNGEAQRIALARIILQKRPLVLLDEATGYLDEACAAQVLATLRRKLPASTILYTTHRSSEAALADKVHTMERAPAPALNPAERSEAR